MPAATPFTPAEAKAIEQKSTRWNLLTIRVGLFGLLLLEYFWPSTHPGMIAAYWIITSYFVFGWTSCFHETVHQTLCSSLKFNRHLGRVIGIFTYIPYTAYRESHIRHHAYLNRPEDWELWPYSDPNRSLLFRRVFVWFDLLFGNIAAAIVYGRIFFRKDSPLSDESRKTIRNEYLFMLVFWIVFATYLTLTNSWWGFFRIWYVPTWIAGNLQAGRKMTEHLGMISYDPMLGTRTVRGKSWATLFASFLNFDIFVHGPHHRHPRAAHTDLGKMMDDYVSKHPETEYPVFASYWRATKSMVPWMFKNPGVGLNIGAQKEAIGGTAQDFESDVTEGLAQELAT